MDQSTVKIRCISLENLKKIPLVDPNGEKVGVIEELIIDSSRGSIDKVILAMSNLLGIKRLVALAWNNLQVNAAGELSVNLDKDFLKNVPTYKGDMD